MSRLGTLLYDLGEMKDKTGLLRSERIKNAIAAVSLIFMLATFIVAMDPGPFLGLGYVGVFVFSLFGSGIFIVPLVSRYLNIVVVAIVASLAMAINDVVGWYVGKRGHVVFPRSRRVLRAELTLHKYGPYALIFFSFLPLPYDFFGVIAGYLEFPFWRFVIPTFVGRLIRFLLIGAGVIAIWGIY